MRRTLLTLAALLAGGCHDYDLAFDQCHAAGACEPPPGSGALVVDPPELTLRTVVDERVQAPFTVRNVGSVALTGLEVGQPAESFFTSATDCGPSLAPGAECGGIVTFQRDAQSPLDSVLSVSTVEAGEVSVLLHGRVLPRLTATPESYYFGTVYETESSAPIEVVVRNNSPLYATSPLEVSVPSLFLSIPFFPLISYGPQYAFDAGTCVGPLPPLGECRLEVQARPSQIEQPAVQPLTIEGRADAGPRDEVTTVLLDMHPLRYATLEFKVLIVGALEADAGSSIARAYNLQNTSTTHPTSDLRFAVLDDAGVLAVDAGNCVGSLAPTAVCTFSFTLGSPTGGLFDATLLAMADGARGDALAITLRSIDLVPLAVWTSDGGAVTSDAGVDCPGQCDVQVRRFMKVTLTAQPDPGLVLDRWGGECADAGAAPSCTLFPDGGVSVEAWFR